MKILFVREKWADGQESKGSSDGSYMVDTVEAAGHQRAIFYYDESTVNDKDDFLLRIALDVEHVDVVMFSHLISWGDRNLKKDTWKTLRLAGKKVVGVWHESSPDVIRVADEHADCVDLNLFLDTKDQFLKYSRRPEKCFGLYDPRSSQVFQPREKTIPVLFNGTLVNRQFRCACVFTLLANGVPVTKIGGRSELFLPEDMMVSMLGETKICLNFSDGGQGKHYKGRVAEALLCGCLLMEWENDETSSMLEPFKEYIPFSTPDDLLQKVQYYMRHDLEREKIAAAGRGAALEKLDGRVFWAQLFRRLAFEQALEETNQQFGGALKNLADK